jgi:large subunit ribosomal protein L18
LAAYSDLKLEKTGTKTNSATTVWSEVAKLALAKDVKRVVFDRNGFAYHGRVKALAEAAREAGLKF